MPNESAKGPKEIAVNGATIGPALRQAAREAIERHRQTGFPVVLWENGQIVHRDAAEVLAEMDAERTSAE
jgi:hypothetical protein